MRDTQQALLMSKPINKAYALAIVGMAWAGISVNAAPLKSLTYDGHTYELWEAYDISWADAKTAAEARGGYLAVLTTEDETMAVYNGFIGTGFFLQADGQAYSAYLGATPRDGSSSTTDPANWAWITGENWTAFDTSNWAGGEPNGDSEGLTINRFGNWNWNDEGGLVGGYIVETTPDGGSTFALLGGIVAIFCALRRNFRK